jgi:PPOX class probable F420-dependent enzyme
MRPSCFLVKMKAMELDEAREFIRKNHHAVFSAFRPDGTPQMSPVLVAVDSAGHVLVSSRETAYKVKQVRRDPRVSLCVLTNKFFGDWIQVEGEATVVSLPEAMDGLVDYYRRINGEHNDWNDYRAAMGREKRVLVRISLRRAGPDRKG